MKTFSNKEEKKYVQVQENNNAEPYHRGFHGSRKLLALGLKFKLSPNGFLYRALPYGRIFGEKLTRKFKGKGKIGIMNLTNKKGDLKMNSIKETLTKNEKRALREIEWFPDEKHVDVQDMLEHGEIIDLTPENFGGAEDPESLEAQKEVLRAIYMDISRDKEVKDCLLKYVVKNSKEELTLLYTEANRVFVVSEGNYQGVYIRAI